MKVERVVVDTNVLISAALSPHSSPAKVVSKVLDCYRLVFSEETFAAFESRLWRHKFDRYLSADDRGQLLHDFVAVADWVALGVAPQSWSRDCDDDKFIHTALVADASWLISGDNDLLELSSVNDVSILSPAQALQQFRAVAREQARRA